MRKAWLVVSALAFIILGQARAAPTDIIIDDQGVFPESLGSADGTLYIGSTAKSRIYRALPGQGYAEPWISKESGDFHRILGVLADKATNTLWVCDNNHGTAVVKTFALKTGKSLKSYSFPGGGSCNDIAIRKSAAYVTDTAHGRILKLAPGAGSLVVWYDNPIDPSLDGLVWARDGNLYADTYGTGHLYRIAINPDGSAGKGVLLNTSVPLFQPDGLRLATDGRILMIEGQGRKDAGLKEGRLDEVTVDGDNATIKILKSGFELPVAVTPLGKVDWVLESKFDYQRNPAMRSQDPGEFHVYAVSAGR